MQKLSAFYCRLVVVNGWLCDEAKYFKSLNPLLNELSLANYT